MNLSKILAVSVSILAVLLTTGPSLAAEEILVWQSAVVVQSDGQMTVSETIRVRAEGRQIKRGIYRDFPTTYRDRLGNKVKVGFDLVSVKRDGRPESFHTEKVENGIRIYAGHKDVILKPGIYTYTITYKTNRQLGFFEEHDELYWNVTGNGWVFPIRRASVSVALPGVPMDQVRTDGFTGPQGSRERSFRSRVEGREQVVFETTRPLGPHEGLTIVVGWPKGFVSEPTLAERARFLLSDMAATLAGLGGLVLLLLYYLWVWMRVGRDPEKGTIIPLFDPPDGLSPAAMRYIREMGFDNRAFASAVINLAVKDYISIEDTKRALGLVTSYIFHRTGNEPKIPLSKGEQKLALKLFPGDQKTLKLEKANHTRISGAINTLKKLLKDEYSKTTFLNNSRYMTVGVMISVAILILWALTGETRSGGPPLFFVILWSVPWAIATLSLWATRKFFMAVIFSLALTVVGGVFAATTSLVFIVSLILLIAINVLFYILLKAPTNLGRRIMDRIEGFRMYLSIAEEHRLEKLHPPEKTPELFEKYLPYALALDVDQEWSEKFATVLKQAAQSQGYSPAWYHGDSWDHARPAMFASALGSSLSSAISSSSTAPGSSSGFGGGSSGGGGGGGGGGGW